jgi:hypothetical protein
MRTTTISQLQNIIRKKIGLKATDALFFFSYNSILHSSHKIGEIYDRF